MRLAKHKSLPLGDIRKGSLKLLPQLNDFLCDIPTFRWRCMRGFPLLSLPRYGVAVQILIEEVNIAEKSSGVNDRRWAYIII